MSGLRHTSFDKEDKEKKEFNDSYDKIPYESNYHEPYYIPKNPSTSMYPEDVEAGEIKIVIPIPIDDCGACADYTSDSYNNNEMNAEAERQALDILEKFKPNTHKKYTITTFTNESIHNIEVSIKLSPKN